MSDEVRIKGDFLGHPIDVTITVPSDEDRPEDDERTQAEKFADAIGDQNITDVLSKDKPDPEAEDKKPEADTAAPEHTVAGTQSEGVESE